MKVNLNLDNLSNNDEDLSLVSIKLEYLVVNSDRRVFAILSDDDERKTGLELNNYEATMLSFCHKEFHKNSHINTIHQIFLKFLKSFNIYIENICIESKVGDVVYVTIQMCDENFNRSFSVISLADALIFSRLLDVNIKCIKKLWLQFDDADDWDFEDYIIEDYDDDDD